MIPGRNRLVFERLYGPAQGPEDLPWYRPEPPELLVKAVDARETPGRALDVGCGAGTYSLYLAERGWEVTGIDMMPKAIELLRQAAAARGLDITAEQADALTWQAAQPFDLVLDVGCLHSIANSDRPRFREQLLQWLAPGGDFVMVHSGRRGWWDRWPLGPNRVYAREVIALFSPELTLVERQEEVIRMPLPVGYSALASRYWFRRVA